MPVSGDAFELVPNQLTPRFKANGLFGYDTNVGDALQAILDNCDGTFIQADGKIKLVIPRKLTAAELADLDNQDILTDKGANATIIRRGGKSTLRWVPKPLDQAPNEIWYEFTDRDSDFENKRLAIRLDDAQAALGAVYSEPRRDIQSETLSLGLTNTRDQGARIATRRIRRNGMILGGWRNGRLEMEVPIHVAIKLRPVEDVRKIASDGTVKLTDLAPNQRLGHSLSC